MRSPFSSETEAFRFLLLLVAAVIPIVLATVFGPTWLVVVVLVLVLGAVAVRAAALHMQRLRDPAMQVKMAPPHIGSPSDRRVLVVANQTLDEDALLSELERLASNPSVRIRVLAPALISPAARMTGGIDGLLAEARAKLQTALGRIGHSRAVSGEISDADPLHAIEDEFATFVPDEVIVSTRWERTEGGLDPLLAGLVRERFAVPVRHLVFEPGADARESDRETEVRYRREAGDTAARRFGLSAVVGVAVLAALVLSTAALIRSSEHSEQRSAAEAAANQRLVEPGPVANVVALKVIPEGKRGPEGEKHDEFTTTEFTVKVGQPQLLKIDNTDTVPHSITAPGAGVNIVVMPGVHTYKLLLQRAGTYLWFCTFVCDEWAMHHPGYMSGYITAVAS
jgi:plastocyanin